MGDHRAGPSGPTATADLPRTAAPGKRAARHATEPRTSAPYAGRRVARADTPAPAPTVVIPAVVVPAPDPAPAPAPLYVGRRVAGRDLVAPPPPVEVEHVSALPVSPTPYAGRRVARPVEVVAAPEPVVDETPVIVQTPVVIDETPVALEAPVAIETPVVIEEVPVVETPVVEAPVVETPLVAEEAPAALRLTTPKPIRAGGRRAASRRTRVPSLPLLAGVAVLAISAGGALQAMHPGAAAADGRISPASALSATGALGSHLAGRDTPVSRSADRQALSVNGSGSLRAAADAQATERDDTLSALAGQAEQRARDLKLHQWVLPVAPGVYHLTARFGDYSSLWSNFHTGLDFAAPTGTPIMAVAGGVITETGYSGAYGNRTIERLPDGTELWYCHQNEFGTSVGAKVSPGQVIGYVGSTGNVTGPHLHLEVHPGGGDPVDPYPVLVAHGLYPGPPA